MVFQIGDWVHASFYVRLSPSLAHQSCVWSTHTGRLFANLAHRAVHDVIQQTLPPACDPENYQDTCCDFGAELGYRVILTNQDVYIEFTSLSLDSPNPDDGESIGHPAEGFAFNIFGAGQRFKLEMISGVLPIIPGPNASVKNIDFPPKYLLGIIAVALSPAHASKYFKIRPFIRSSQKGRNHNEFACSMARKVRIMDIPATGSECFNVAKCGRSAVDANRQARNAGPATTTPTVNHAAEQTIIFDKLSSSLRVPVLFTSLGVMDVSAHFQKAVSDCFRRSLVPSVHDRRISDCANHSALHLH